MTKGQYDRVHGIKNLCPLSSLKTFTGPEFFVFDEMHGICHGIARQLWQLFSGRYDTKKKNPFGLPRSTLNAVAEAIPSNKHMIPTIAVGDSWKNIEQHGGQMRAVDWSDFLLYIVPTLIAEDHITDATAKQAILSLVLACRLIQSWTITSDQVTVIQR